MLTEQDTHKIKILTLYISTLEDDFRKLEASSDSLKEKVSTLTTENENLKHDLKSLGFDSCNLCYHFNRLQTCRGCQVQYCPDCSHGITTQCIICKTFSCQECILTNQNSHSCKNCGSWLCFQCIPNIPSCISCLSQDWIPIQDDIEI